MASQVQVQQLGGEVEIVHDVSTVQDVLDSLGLEGTRRVSVNGEPATPESTVSDYDFVAVAENLKGGNL